MSGRPSRDCKRRTWEGNTGDLKTDLISNLGERTRAQHPCCRGSCSEGCGTPWGALLELSPFECLSVSGLGAGYLKVAKAVAQQQHCPEGRAGQ